MFMVPSSFPRGHFCSAIHFYQYIISSEIRSEDHSSHSQEEEEESKSFIWKMLVLLIAIYVFYLVELLFAFVSRRFNGIDTHHHIVPEPHSAIKLKALNGNSAIVYS